VPSWHTWPGWRAGPNSGAVEWREVEAAGIFRFGMLDDPTISVVHIPLPQLAVVLPICDALNAAVRTIR
jgi:hypothetical protein